MRFDARIEAKVLWQRQMVDDRLPDKQVEIDTSETRNI